MFVDVTCLNLYIETRQLTSLDVLFNDLDFTDPVTSKCNIRNYLRRFNGNFERGLNGWGADPYVKGW